MSYLALRAKDTRKLGPKERRQKLRRMQLKGQKKIIKGVPYYDPETYKRHVREPRNPSKARNFQKAQKRIDAMIDELTKKYPPPEYRIWVNPATGRGADIVVERRNGKTGRYRQFEAYELTNYTKNGYISEKDIKRYVDTLKKFKCKRKLVVSYHENLYNRAKKVNYKDVLMKYNVEVEVKGEIRLGDEEGWDLWDENTDDEQNIHTNNKC